MSEKRTVRLDYSYNYIKGVVSGLKKKGSLYVIGSFNNWGNTSNELIQKKLSFPLNEDLSHFFFKADLSVGLNHFKIVVVENINESVLKIVHWISCPHPYTPCFVDEAEETIFCDTQHNNNWVLPLKK